MKTEYFLVLVLVLLGPLILTIVMRLDFYRRTGPLIKTAIIVCSIYWLWDVVVTSRGHWSFNPSYVLGWTVLGMPLEEWLFFPVIVFVSIFTYEATMKILRKRQ